MTTGIAPFGALVATVDVDTRVGAPVGAGGADDGAGGADVATDGLGETALGDGAAAGGVADDELAGVKVVVAPQPSIATASATMTKAHRGFMVEAFPPEAER
jgi:hypothetical protein